MHTGRWTGALAVLALAGCQEAVTAPGVCPEYCPGTSIDVADSVLAGSVVSDTTYTGYVGPWAAGAIYLAADPAGSGPRSRGVVRFPAFSERLVIASGDTTTAPAVTDSLQLQVTVRRRFASATGLRVAVYRLPAAVDSLVAFDDLEPQFMDSARVGAIAIPDSLVSGALTVVLPASAFPSFDADARVAALGLALEGSAGPAFADLATAEAGAGASMVRYATIDSAGTPVTRTDGHDRPALDLYVTTGVPAPAGATLAVGGAPSSRTFLGFDIPPGVLDSAQIVRATVALVPAGPIVGVPGDTVTMLAHSIPADFGAKSPFNPIHPDSVSRRSSHALVGSGDTVFVDVTDILRRWQTAPAEPRVIVLRATPEGGSFAEARFDALGTAAGPALIVTYVPRLRFGR
jgi:hypothetical protein